MDLVDGGGGSSGPTERPYQSILDDPSEVNVDIPGLVGYYLTMSQLAAEAMAPTTTELSEMGMLIHDGLAAPPRDGINPLPEGIMMARFLQHRQSDFQHFLTDVVEGISNIGAAAAVVAEIFENADSENAATVSDIGFAFFDPRAGRPDGFRPGEEVKSADQVRREEAEAAGQTSMAALGTSQPTHSYSAGPYREYRYADGSYKQVRGYQEPGEAGWTSDAWVMATEIFLPDGTLVSATTERSYSSRGGSQHQDVTVTTPGQDGGSSSSTTSTIDHPDGKKTVTSTTSTTGADGEETRESQSITVDPDDRHKEASGEVGPLQELQQDLGTEGSDENKRYYGTGY